MQRGASCRRAAARIIVSAAAGGALAIAVSACSAAAPLARPTVTVTVTAPAPTPSPLLPADSAPLDLAGVCAGESVIQTAIQYTRDQDPRLTSSQSDAILDAVTAQYEELRIGARETTARHDVTRIVDYLEGLHGKPGGRAFDPDAKGIVRPESRIAALCHSNATPVSVFATVGG